MNGSFIIWLLLELVRIRLKTLSDKTPKQVYLKQVTRLRNSTDVDVLINVRQEDSTFPVGSPSIRWFVTKIEVPATSRHPGDLSTSSSFIKSWISVDRRRGVWSGCRSYGYGTRSLYLKNRTIVASTIGGSVSVEVICFGISIS